MSSDTTPSTNFIHAIIEDDLSTGKNDGRVHTRFPPEPNGRLHIGHAKAICINFGTALKYGGKANLRFDDTNPTKENVEFVEAIKNDIHWLGFDWEDRLYYASDYFPAMYDYAVQLIEKGKAYVCDLTAEEIREYRGTLTEPGKDSPHRDRSMEENLDLFARMRAGEFPDGSRVLRAKIDMTHSNILLRDPVMYRIMHAHHHHVGDEWCIYPTYDWAHGLEDAIEGITHSLCSYEFEIHRPLYDWFLDQLDGLSARPRQIEFAPLTLTYTVLSKRKLVQLVDEGFVSDWEDPRMPTLSGLRRRGVTPSAIRNFCEGIGVTKYPSLNDTALFEHYLREDLNKSAPRALAVLNPLKVVITNYPEDGVEELEAVNNPEDPAAGTRKLPFCREIFIEKEDFREDPPRKFHRLGPGREVRLRYGYFITCTSVIKNDAGNVIELHCTYDPETRGGSAPDGRKVKGTIHWVSARHAIDADVRLYDRLFTKENMDDLAEDETFLDYVNPNSLEVLSGCKLELSLKDAEPGVTVQFERHGYFCLDGKDSSPGKPAFNRTVALRDSWAKIEKKAGKEPAKGKGQGATGAREPDNLISIDDFGKLQLKTATVLEAERVPDADRLLRLQVDVAGEKRQVVAGIAKVYTPEDLVGKTVIVVTNLKPARIRGVESNGMLLAASKKRKMRVLTVDGEIPSGASVG